MSDKLIEETAGNGKLIADYIYLNGKPLAMITKQANGEATFYYHNDHLGTPKVMTDVLKKVVWNVEFDPFGHDVSQTGRAGSYIRNITNNLRFPGQYYDAETGLSYNYYRDYNPAIGRYIEADPIGLKSGMNQYVYVGNEPTINMDLKGEAVYSCVRPLKGVSPIVYQYLGIGHEYLWVDSMNNGYGLAPRDGYQSLALLIPVPGFIETEAVKVGTCFTVTTDDCQEKKIKAIIEAEIPLGHIYDLRFHNCYNWVDSVLQRANE